MRAISNVQAGLRFPTPDLEEPHEICRRPAVRPPLV